MTWVDGLYTLIHALVLKVADGMDEISIFF